MRARDKRKMRVIERNEGEFERLTKRERAK